MLPAHVDSAAIANPEEVDLGCPTLWLLSFGAYGETHVYAWTDSLESAFEVAVEYLDEEGQCGHFTLLSGDDYAAAADELGVRWDPEAPDDAVIQHAEADLTPIGWTTLDCERESGASAFVPSWEWTGRQVRGQERARVEERSWRLLLEEDE